MPNVNRGLVCLFQWLFNFNFNSLYYPWWEIHFDLFYNKFTKFTKLFSTIKQTKNTTSHKSLNKLHYKNITENLIYKFKKHGDLCIIARKNQRSTWFHNSKFTAQTFPFFLKQKALLHRLVYIAKLSGKLDDKRDLGGKLKHILFLYNIVKDQGPIS